MKHKLYLLVALTLIAFVAITSYTPKAAQAEMSMQEDPVSETEEIPSTDMGEVTYAEDFVILTDADSVDLPEDFADPDADDQINADNGYDYYSAVGINFVPHDDFLSWYNGGLGCLGSNYDGTTPKTYTLAVNVTHGAQGSGFDFTYRNKKEAPGGPIEVILYRKRYDSLATEMVKKYTLQKDGVGEHWSVFNFDHTFETGAWNYWIEFKLPTGTAFREFCSFRMRYKNPPLSPFSMTQPMITNNK